jgi:hypothetical protein
VSVIPDCLRSAVISPTIGNLTFTPASGSVTYYEARVYAEGTTTPILATKYLGLPGTDPVTGLIKVNILTMMNALAAGNYEVIVAAVGPGGTTESSHAGAYAVPLQAA